MTRILYLAANPTNTDKLQLDTEIVQIRHGLDKAKFHRQFRFKLAEKTSLRDFSNFLKEFKPDIVHFSGHGNLHAEIYLEDRNGYADPISKDILQSIITLLKGKIRCVVLNSCYTESQAFAIAEAVDCVVVGMLGSVSDQYSIEFARTFYREIADGEDVAKAFKLGRDHMRDERELARMFTYNVNPSQTTFVELPPPPPPPVESLTNKSLRYLIYILGFILPIYLIHQLAVRVLTWFADGDSDFLIKSFSIIIVLLSCISMAWGAFGINPIFTLIFGKKTRY